MTLAILLFAGTFSSWAHFTKDTPAKLECDVRETKHQPDDPQVALRKKLALIQPMVNRFGTTAILDWKGIHDRIIATAKAQGQSEESLQDLTVSIFRNGIKVATNIPWMETSHVFSDESPGQVDYYIVHRHRDAKEPAHEVMGEPSADMVDVSEFALKETSDGQNIADGSFTGVYAGELFGFQLNGQIQNTGVRPELTSSSVRLGYKKVVWVLSPEAESHVRDFIHAAGNGVDVKANFGAQGAPTSVTITDRKTGSHITTENIDNFFFKVDAAFNGNAFFWDDMLVALATVPYHPWLAQSTLKFWLMVQKRNGGTIPREVRKESLISLWWPTIVRYGEPRRTNLTFTNPYLMNWLMDELYRYNPSSENLGLLKQVAQSVRDYSSWMEAHRAVKDAQGQIIGFNGSALGSGADNSRGRLGNNYEEKAYKTGFVDTISQQLAMYNDLRRWNNILARAETDGAEKAKLFNEANVVKAKADQLRNVLNTRYWNQDKGFYFDLIPDGNGGWIQNLDFMPIGGFWALWGGAPNRAQVQRIIDMQLTPEAFGGDFPLPANARHMIREGHPTDPLYIPRPNYRDEDGYWDKWAHWPSMMMVAIEGFRRVGRPDIAYDLSAKVLKYMAQSSVDTVEESYGEVEVTMPDGTISLKARPLQHSSHQHRSDFAGWGKGPPIYNLINHFLGMRPTYTGVMEWNLPVTLNIGDSIGVKNLIYLGGTVRELSVKKIADQTYEVTASSEGAFTLVFKGAQPVLINGGGEAQTVQIAVPEHRLNVVNAGP